MRIWLVGGGTAGHVSPLLSLATELKARKDSRQPIETRLVIDHSPTANQILAKVESSVSKIHSGKLRRYRGRNWWSRLADVKTWLLNAKDMLLVLVGLLQSIWLINKHKPTVIFINGGSIGVPVALGARLYRVPYIIHESDTVMGLANRIIAKHAVAIASAFDVDFGSKLTPRVRVTGIPLKPQFLSVPDEATINNLATGMNLEANLPIVLAVGGSLGAERLNNWLVSQADELLETCQLVLVTGHRNYAATQSMLAEKPPVLAARLHVLEFSDRMAELMYMADVVITRAGATTLMELAAVGRAAIIVPNDMLSGGHQTVNAQWFSSAGMAETLSEANISTDPSVLVRAIHGLLSDEPRRRRIANAITRASLPNSAQLVVDQIIIAGQRRTNDDVEKKT